MYICIYSFVRVIIPCKKLQLMTAEAFAETGPILYSTVIKIETTLRRLLTPAFLLSI